MAELFPRGDPHTGVSTNPRSDKVRADAETEDARPIEAERSDGLAPSPFTDFFSGSAFADPGLHRHLREQEGLPPLPETSFSVPLGEQFLPPSPRETGERAWRPPRFENPTHDRPLRPGRPSRRRSRRPARAGREPSQDAAAQRQEPFETSAPAAEQAWEPPPTDPADWGDDAPFDPADVATAPNQVQRSRTAAPATGPRAHETHRWWDPHRDYYASAPRSPPQWDLDWLVFADELVSTALLGAAMAIAAGFGIAAGIISAPFVVVAGGLMLAIGGTQSFFDRANLALDLSLKDFSGRAALAAAGDPIGITPLVEGIRGYDVVTGLRLDSYERSRRLGRGAGALATIATGPKTFKFGRSMGQGAIKKGFIDPYSVPSISRPGPKNPLVIGRYKTPEGVVLEGVRPFQSLRWGVQTYRNSGGSRLQRLERALAAADAGFEGNYAHILRHFRDQPNRVLANNNPQIHSVFNRHLESQVARLIDDAVRQGTGVEGLMVPQGDRVALIAFTDVPVGRALGNRQWYLANFGDYRHYGAPLDHYVLVLEQQTMRAVTMYPGVPNNGVGPLFIEVPP